MLAFTGYVVTAAGVRFPGAEDIPSGFAALDAVPGMVWAQFIATVALMEAANRDQSGTAGVSSSWKPEFQGDFRNGALDFGWDKYDDAAKKRKRSIEINNGRAAMMASLASWFMTSSTPTCPSSDSFNFCPKEIVKHESNSMLHLSENQAK